MKPETPNVVPLRRQSPTARLSASRAYGVEVDAVELRREMRRLGITGAELARRAKVSPATVSHALNGRRIHPAKLRAIRAALNDMKPMPGWDNLLRKEQSHRVTSDLGEARAQRSAE
jgi:transcriptional regulator with XRE-family HTH domain